MKKIVLVLIIGLIVGTAAFADHEGLGIGIIGGGSLGWYHGGFVGLSLKIPAVPIYWGIYPGFYRHGVSVGLTGDFYIFDNNLYSSQMTNEDGTYNFKLDWFLGVGGYVNMHLWKDNTGASFGVRVPIGLSWHIIRQLELFFDIGPSIGFYLGGDGPHMDANGFAELGLRFWVQ